LAPRHGAGDLETAAVAPRQSAPPRARRTQGSVGRRGSAPSRADALPSVGATACCDAGRPPMEVTMLQRGEIVVERLTGNRAMVIRVVGPEEVTTRITIARFPVRRST